jgi:hypothetical protein
MRTRNSVFPFDGFPLYVDYNYRLVDERMLSLAKMKATVFFRTNEHRYRSVFRRYATRKYRCKPSAVHFDSTAESERRIRNAVLVSDPSCYGITNGFVIEISDCMPMGFDQLVGTLVHEALHCFCRVRGRWLPTSAEHHCMRVLGEDADTT